MRDRKARVLAVAAALLFAVIILGSLTVIAVGPDHDCDGEECAVCETLQQCERLLTGWGSPLGTCVSHYALMVVFIAFLFCGRVFSRINTLISLKVELLD